MEFIAWLFGSKPCFRTDGFEPIMARDFVATWSAKFEPTRSLLQIDRLDSMDLGEFESKGDTSAWLVDPVDSNEATQVDSNLASWMVSSMTLWMGSNQAPCLGLSCDSRLESN